MEHKKRIVKRVLFPAAGVLFLLLSVLVFSEKIFADEGAAAAVSGSTNSTASGWEKKDGYWYYYQNGELTYGKISIITGTILVPRGTC